MMRSLSSSLVIRSISMIELCMLIVSEILFPILVYDIKVNKIYILKNFLTNVIYFLNLFFSYKCQALFYFLSKSLLVLLLKKDKKVFFNLKNSLKWVIKYK